MGLRGPRARQTNTCRTRTKGNKADPITTNVFEGDFEAEWPNNKWLAGITYIPTEERWFDLAVMMHMYGLRLVG